MRKPFDKNIITQVGIVVNDVEKTAQAYAAILGVEMPSIDITDTVDKSETEYNGEQSIARAKLAFFDLGSVQLELIEPDKNPSTWREHLNEKGEGVHHIAFVVDDMKETVKEMEARDMPLIQKGEFTGGRYAYMDTTNELKVLIELLENDNKGR